MDSLVAPLPLVYESAAPTIPWWERIDPINEITWHETTACNWFGVATYAHTIEPDSLGYLSHVTREYPSPILRSNSALYNHRAITAMAMLHEWNTLSTFQLATLLGVGHRAVWNTMFELYSAGLVKRMVPPWWEGSAQESGTGSVWRIDRRSWTTEAWFERLQNLEWMLSTNESDPLVGSIGANTPAALRHNMGTVDLCIKAMETIPAVIGAWGESHAESWRFYEPSRYEEKKLRDNVGDAVLVTQDGKVIVLESSGAGARSVTGQAVGNRLAEKAGAWVSVCGKSDLDLYVVFIEMSSNPLYGHFRKMVDLGVDKVSKEYVSSRSIREKGQQRVLVADSREWFPFARGISTAFTRLECESTATGEVVALATDSPMQLSDVVTNTVAAIHTPAWITKRDLG